MADAAIDVLVIGAGVTGLAAALEIASRGHSTGHRRAAPAAGDGDEHAQQRRDPCRPLLPGRDAEGAAVRRRRQPPVSVLREHGCPAERCGKLVVAVEDHEIPTIEAIASLGDARTARSGWKSSVRAFVRQREPHVRALAALWSPNTGASKRSRWCGRCSGWRSGRRGAAATGAGGRRRTRGRMAIFAVRTERETIEARVVVNAAGLYADDVSAAFGGEAFRIYPCRGEYAELKREPAATG